MRCHVQVESACDLSADFARNVCRWARIMWKKICFLVRGGAYAFEKHATLHCASLSGVARGPGGPWPPKFVVNVFFWNELMLLRAFNV